MCWHAHVHVRADMLRLRAAGSCHRQQLACWDGGTGGEEEGGSLHAWMPN